MKAIIIGYGRAGKRHGQLLNKFGIEWHWYDPFIDIEDSKRVDSYNNTYDLAIICTPPNYHLDQIGTCLALDIDKILCEKPLCGFGQLDHAHYLSKTDKVMVAYNYRFHPNWQQPIKAQYDVPIICISQSDTGPIPSWGIVLDRLSHTVDTLLNQGIQLIKIENVSHRQLTPYEESITITGKSSSSQPFMIFDGVKPSIKDKFGLTIGPFGLKLGQHNEGMFDNMYHHFLKQDSFSLRQAIEVQKTLERIEEIRV